MSTAHSGSRIPEIGSARNATQQRVIAAADLITKIKYFYAPIAFQRRKKMSDTLAIANSFIALIGTMFTGVMAYLMTKLNQKQAQASVKADEAALKAEEVKANLAVAAAVTEKKLERAAGKVEEVKNTLEAAVEARVASDAQLDEVKLLLQEINKSTEKIVSNSTLRAGEIRSEALRSQEKLDKKIESITQTVDNTYTLVKAIVQLKKEG